jgi:hypothetical protein
VSLYQIEKLEFPVTLFLFGGQIREGVIFLSLYSALHSGPQSPLELLNETEPFLPFRREKDLFSLVNKKALTQVRFEPPQDGGDHVFGERVSVRIHFLGGETLQGTLTLEAPAGRNRLKDFLSHHRGFFLLDCGLAHYLINPAQICEITPG